MTRKVEYELAIAVAELHEAIEFIIELPHSSIEAMIEKAKERDPSYIRHVRIIEGSPQNAFEFWMGFGAWIISGLHDKYRHIWDEVNESYWKSQFAMKAGIKARLVTQIDQVLEAAGFSG